MSDSSVLSAQSREKVGTTTARTLRNEGRIPATLQADSDNPHVDISIDEHEFLASRRKHVHLYDIDVAGDVSSAIVRELQWDTFGDNIIHVEFRRVTRGVEIESEVELRAVGQADGIVNLLVSHVMIKSIPSMIPNALEIDVKGKEEGTHLSAADITMPEGVSLAIDLETEVITISGLKEEVEEPVATEDGIEPEAGEGASDAEDAPADEGDSGESSED